MLRESRARYRLENPHPIGADRDAGEIDPERLHQSLETIDDEPDHLARLSEPPAAGIKFFIGREQRDLQALMAATRLRERLLLSVLRAAVFGDIQSRLPHA